MESRDVDHADAGVSRTAKTQPRRTRRDKRPDAMLRYLIAHAEFDLALLFVKGQYLLYQRVGKVLRTKGVSPETLYAAFAAELGDSGWLTPDVMRCGVGPAGAFAVKFVAPGKHLLHFDAGNPSKPLLLTVPLPPLVFAGVNVPEGSNRATYHVWAMREATFRPEAVLCHAPLPNVYDDGRICWGENHPPEVALATIDQAWRLFISSLFTGEMGEERSKEHPRDVRGLFLALSGSDRYPVEDLQPAVSPHRSRFVSSREAHTVEEAIEKYILKEEQWQ